MRPHQHQHGGHHDHRGEGRHRTLDAGDPAAPAEGAAAGWPHPDGDATDEGEHRCGADPECPEHPMGTGRRRGRPRSAAAATAIIEAVLDLLAEGTPPSALAVEAVAARAGVGKATIYRRWPSKDDLIIAALDVLHRELPEVPGKSIREDLLLLLEPIRQRNLDDRVARIFPRVIGDGVRHPEFVRRYRAAVVDRRAQGVRDVLRRGVASGELRPDLDITWAATLLTGGLLFRTLVQQPGIVPEPQEVETLVDLLLDGLRPRATAPPGPSGPAASPGPDRSPASGS